MVAIPRPLPETRMISMSSRLRLKYWPTINVAGSRVMATPIPVTKKNTGLVKTVVNDSTHIPVTNKM